MDVQLRLRDPIAPQLVAALRQAIIASELRPGEALSEKEIAGRFGVSRQPVREAFIKLSEAGLVQILPSRGTYVMKISLREVANARFVREAVECSLARAASRLIDPAGVALLRRLIAEDDPLIQGYDEPEWARRLHYDRPVDESVAVLRAVRASSLQLLRSLAPEEWDRSGTHSESGPYDIDTWLGIYADHSHEHAAQIERARRGED